MTVDLPWDWWVTSGIAAAVAVVCAAAFWRLQGAAVRAIAATLAVQGAILAAVAPVVMPDEMETAVPALSREEFAQQADANCERAGARFGSLGEAEELPALADEMEELMPIYWESIGAQARLVASPDEAPLAMAWMRGMARAGNELDAVRLAARQRDSDRVAAAWARFGTIAEENARLSKELGMRGCWQS